MSRARASRRPRPPNPPPQRSAVQPRQDPMTLIQSFIHNPVKVTVGVLIVALFGVISLLRMPMQLTPEVQIPTITVTTRWPGASPQEIEREIVREQEEFLQSVEGVTKMTSESQDSAGTITLEFKVGTNMEESLLKVNSRLQQVPEYPIDADQPVISASSAADRPIAWFILSDRLPEADEIRKFQRAHPDAAADLEPVLRTDNPGLAALRLRRAAEKNPVLRPLLPDGVRHPETAEVRRRPHRGGFRARRGRVELERLRRRRAGVPGDRRSRSGWPPAG